MNLLTAHPNASVATGGGVAGILAVWLLGLLGIDIGGVVGAAIATAAGSTVLFIGKNGIQGAIQLIWRGKDKPA